MLTQPAVKTSLAWSTVAQMGFMIFECGLALFSDGVAAHRRAFALQSALVSRLRRRVLERVAAIRRPGPVAVPHARAVAEGLSAVAIAIYLLLGFGLRPAAHNPRRRSRSGRSSSSAWPTALAQGLADAAARGALTGWTAAHAVATSLGYFALQGRRRHLDFHDPAAVPLLPARWNGC